LPIVFEDIKNQEISEDFKNANLLSDNIPHKNLPNFTKMGQPNLCL
jgi:hypothetical protein